MALCTSIYKIDQRYIKLTNVYTQVLNKILKVSMMMNQIICWVRC